MAHKTLLDEDFNESGICLGIYAELWLQSICPRSCESCEHEQLATACYCSFANSPTPATATQSRVVFFTKYIASSARCSSSALVRGSVGYDATPTLAVRLTVRPGSRSHFVSRMSLWMRRATPIAFSFEVCGSRITNSSPP